MMATPHVPFRNRGSRVRYIPVCYVVRRVIETFGSGLDVQSRVDARIPVAARQLTSTVLHM